MQAGVYVVCNTRCYPLSLVAADWYSAFKSRPALKRRDVISKRLSNLDSATYCTVLLLINILKPCIYGSIRQIVFGLVARGRSNQRHVGLAHLLSLRNRRPALGSTQVVWRNHFTA